MNIAVWVAQILLVVVFLGAGAVKAVQPKEKIVKSLAWAADFSPVAITLIGVVEVLGALGLALPAVTGIATVLTPLAAMGLAIVMLGAIVTQPGAARRR